MKVKLILIFLSLLVIGYVYDDLEKVDKENYKNSYKGKMSNKARAYSLVGMKKAGAGILLLRQTANIGETLEGNKSSDIKKSSLEISELNPYFLENYYAGANVLAFIKTYLDYEGATEILNRGLEYNPNDEFLKKYLAGIVAGSKGNNDEVVANYEEIVKKYPDPLMFKVIYDIYKEKLKKNKKFEEKYLYYAEILYSNEKGKYKEIIKKDLKEFGYIK